MSGNVILQGIARTVAQVKAEANAAPVKVFIHPDDLEGVEKRFTMFSHHDAEGKRAPPPEADAILYGLPVECWEGVPRGEAWLIYPGHPLAKGKPKPPP